MKGFLIVSSVGHFCYTVKKRASPAIIIHTFNRRRHSHRSFIRWVDQRYLLHILLYTSACMCVCTCAHRLRERSIILGCIKNKIDRFTRRVIWNKNPSIIIKVRTI